MFIFKRRRSESLIEGALSVCKSVCPQNEIQNEIRNEIQNKIPTKWKLSFYMSKPQKHF